jgi:cysteine desulfurase
MDYAATTPVDDRVLKVMLPYFSETYGNASEIHSLGLQAREAMGDAREKVAHILNSDSGRVFFTSGATESNNLALKGAAFASEKKRHIIISSIEHHCVLDSAEWLKSRGFDLSFLPVDEQGLVNPNEVEQMIRDDTLLVSVMHSNNEIGVLEPIAEIGEICQRKGVYLHSDAVQSVGKVPVDVEKLNVDLLSSSSHKLYGPKGVGALYIREGVNIEPLSHGGGHEQGVRSGTENVAGVVGFGEACRIAEVEMPVEAPRLTKLRDKLISRILEIGETRLNGHPTKRLPNNINISFKYIEGESLLLKLDDKGVAASSGSACSSTSSDPSHVLMAIGLKPEDARGSLRLTLGRWTSEEEVSCVLEMLPEIVDELRLLSPLA